MMKEEMRRTLESLGWEAKEWEKRAVLRHEQDAKLDPALQEGLRAYAFDQANVRTSLEKHFRSMWEAPLAETAPVSSNISKPGEDEGGDNDDDDDDDDDGGGDGEGEDQDGVERMVYDELVED